MQHTQQLSEILSDILDISPEEIQPETYLVRDLGAESIDLMELAVTLNNQFSIAVDEDHLFLRSLREHITAAKEQNRDIEEYVQETYPFLDRERVREILSDLEGGPVLKVKDLGMYVDFYSE